MHEIQEKLLKLAKIENLNNLGYRKIGKLIQVDHPQKVKFHLMQLRKKGYITAQNDLNIMQSMKNVVEAQPEFVKIPVLGSANCGDATIFAEEKIEGYIQVSTTLAKRSKGVYALKAVGDSMNKANIQGKNIEEGDYVLVDHQDANYKNNDYVVSVIDGCANIKLLKKNDGQIVLMSESTSPHNPIIIDASDSFLITGKVFNVIKGFHNE
ncbi:MAG: S24 family peptidase [Patescibacteria group bacterium]|uniref:Peptidase S24/S26A/S26B/S26C domain-containing protein n=1 Tax=candidate division WWE3 bacterium TaxID=2053526 RepID=A0A955EEC2_UNCKA|nr:hypothetical protein [candidate division WWE3 bacterium]